MDSWCVRELVVHYQLGRERLALCDPSRGVEPRVTARDPVEWLHLVYTAVRGRSVRPAAGPR